MDTLEDLYKFAKLMAALNKEGLDTELVQIGVTKLHSMPDEEVTRMESDIEQIREKINKHKSEIKDLKTRPFSDIKLNRKVIRGYIDGCYDLMHAGHYNSLRQASKLGDILVTGVNSDIEIEKVKGPTIFKCDERAYMIKSCKWVDEVVPDTEYTPTEETLDRYNCDFYAHGDDIAVNENGEDSASSLKKAGRFKMFKRTKGISTTDIASKLIKIHDAMEAVDYEHGEEIKLESEKSIHLSSTPKPFGAFNSNPEFLASARRIAQFANTKDPSDSDKVVYIDGSFDLFRPGHVEQLVAAKKLGNYLIVGIHDDQCVNSYLGEHYPLNSLHERVLNLLACRYIDDVIIGAPFKITNKMIRDLNISVVVKSLEYMQGMLTEEAKVFNPYEVRFKLNFDSSKLL